MKSVMKLSTRNLPAALVLIAVASLQAQAETITFTVQPGENSEVKFISTAKVESFEGKTDRIAGTFTFDPADLSAALEGKLEVDMTALSTGIKQRDGHMRDNHLHTDQYPRSWFIPKKIVEHSFSTLPGNESVSFRIEGEFFLHGVSRTMQPEVTATWYPDQNALNVLAKFIVRLDDHEIPLPQFLILRLAQEQQVEIRFIATAS